MRWVLNTKSGNGMQFEVNFFRKFNFFSHISDKCTQRKKKRWNKSFHLFLSKVSFPLIGLSAWDQGFNKRKKFRVTKKVKNVEEWKWMNKCIYHSGFNAVIGESRLFFSEPVVATFSVNQLRSFFLTKYLGNWWS